MLSEIYEIRIRVCTYTSYLDHPIGNLFTQNSQRANGSRDVTVRFLDFSRLITAMPDTYQKLRKIRGDESEAQSVGVAGPPLSVGNQPGHFVWS